VKLWARVRCLVFLTHSVVYLRTYRHLSRTVLNCIDSCECEHYLRISEQICLMLMTYWHWLSTSKLHDFLRFLFSCQSSVFTHLSHIVLNCIVSYECEQYVRIPEQRCLMLVTCLYWLSLTVCPLKQYVGFYRFLAFFSKSKIPDFLRFWVAAHVFPNTGTDRTTYVDRVLCCA